MKASGSSISARQTVLLMGVLRVVRAWMLRMQERDPVKPGFQVRQEISPIPAFAILFLKE